MLKLFVCVDESLTGKAEEEEEEGKTGWLSKHDFRALFDPHKFGVPHPNAVLTLMSVGSTTNIVRQFEAISSIGHLKRELPFCVLFMSLSIELSSITIYHLPQHTFKRHYFRLVSKSHRNLPQQQQQQQ